MVYNLATQGAAALLQRLHDDGLQASPERRLLINDLYRIELIAVLERTIRYLYTGAARGLSRKVMDPLWLSRSLLIDGLPAFNPNILKWTSLDAGMRVIVTNKLWPMDVSREMVFSAAEASLMYHYSPAVAGVSVDFFSLVVYYTLLA